MGRTKEMYEREFGEPQRWFSEAQRAHLHWMEQEYKEHQKQKQKHDNDTRWDFLGRG